MCRTLYTITPSVLEMPFRKLKAFPGSNRKNVLGPIAFQPYRQNTTIWCSGTRRKTFGRLLPNSRAGSAALEKRARRGARNGRLRRWSQFAFMPILGRYGPKFCTCIPRSGSWISQSALDMQQRPASWLGSLTWTSYRPRCAKQ